MKCFKYQNTYKKENTTKLIAPPDELWDTGGSDGLVDLAASQAVAYFSLYAFTFVCILVFVVFRIWSMFPSMFVLSLFVCALS